VVGEQGRVELVQAALRAAEQDDPRSRAVVDRVEQGADQPAVADRCPRHVLRQAQPIDRRRRDGRAVELGRQGQRGRRQDPAGAIVAWGIGDGRQRPDQAHGVGRRVGAGRRRGGLQVEAAGVIGLVGRVRRERSSRAIGGSRSDGDRLSRGEPGQRDGELGVERGPVRLDGETRHAPDACSKG
jgi:hypothetical protein